jgi:type IV pilus assembly protein PilW
MNMSRKMHKNQSGMTLMELMISITLGLIVSAAMIALFANTKQSYRMNENVARLQENARFAMGFLSRDVRMADYRACVNYLGNPRLPVPGLTDQNAIEGDDGDNGAPDTITIAWQTDTCPPVIPPTTTTREYSVGTNASGHPALFRSIDGGDAEELVEFIDDLQIFYGVDTGTDQAPDYFVPASGVGDWTRVVSVRFIMSVRSPDENIAEGANQAISREFASVVTLRNRLN